VLETSRGKVPQFTMRPHPMVLGALILILVVGILLALSFFVKEEGTGVYKNRGILTLMITAVLSIFLTILATAKFWYTHLWKKNSSHDRHKQHTQYHPAMRNRRPQQQKRR